MGMPWRLHVLALVSLTVLILLLARLSPLWKKTVPRPVLTRELYVSGFEHPHPELCPDLGVHLKVVIFVMSALSNRSARDAIRLTWGHYAARTDVAIAFMLGAPPESMRANVANEDALYSDVIVGRFVDSYNNMTLKTLSMLEWMYTYCPRAPRLFKTDDDMFINVPRLLQFVTVPSHANASLTVWGKVVNKSLPIRSTRSKYYMSPVQYLGKEFPSYTIGAAYLITTDAVQPLLAAAPKEPYLRLEDIFVTGVLSEKLGIKRLHVPEFFIWKLPPHSCAVQKSVSIHMVRYHEQFDLWRNLLDGKTCAG